MYRVKTRTTFTAMRVNTHWKPRRPAREDQIGKCILLHRTRRHTRDPVRSDIIYHIGQTSSSSYLPSFFFTLFSPITLYQLHNIYGLAAVNVALLLILSFTGHFLRSPSLHHTRSNSCCPICSTPGLLFPSFFRPCCTIKNWLEARSAVS